MRRAEVTIVLPGMLAEAVGASNIRLRAGTLREALDGACAQIPALRFHLFDEQDRLRAHVLCFLNDNSSREWRSADVPVHDGDVITIAQAVSGG